MYIIVKVNVCRLSELNDLLLCLKLESISLFKEGGDQISSLQKCLSCGYRYLSSKYCFFFLCFFFFKSIFRLENSLTLYVV